MTLVAYGLKYSVTHSPRRTWKDGIYTAINERDLRIGERNNRRQRNMEVGKRRQNF